MKRPLLNTPAKIIFSELSKGLHSPCFFNFSLGQSLLPSGMGTSCTQNNQEEEERDARSGERCDTVREQSMTFLLGWSRSPHSLTASVCRLTLLLEFAASLLVARLEWADRRTGSAMDLSPVGAWLVGPKPPSVSSIAASHYRSPWVRPELGRKVVATLWAGHGSVLVIFRNVLTAFPSFPSACGRTERYL